MKKTVLLIATALMVSPAAANAQDADPAPEPVAEAADAEAEDEERVICRRTAVIGSKFKKKICGTKEDWDRMAQNGEDTAKDFRRRGRGWEPGN